MFTNQHKPPIKQRLSQVSLGYPKQHKNLVMFPFVGSKTRALEYRLLDEALANGWIQITEVSKSGSVPNLKVKNKSKHSVLLVDGEELVGAKQNRILNLSVMVPPYESTVIPVSCVEAGRWRNLSRKFSSARRAHYAEGRAAKARHVSESLHRSGSRYSNQAEVWDHISEKMRRMRAHSNSNASAAMYEEHHRRLDDYEKAFSVVEDQAGAVFAINGKVAGMDLFEDAAAFKQFLPKLIQSYALDALEVLPSFVRNKPSISAIKLFADEVSVAEVEAFPAVGLGDDLRLRGKKISGGALIVNKQVVHLCAFRLKELSGTGFRDRDIDLPYSA